MNNFSDFRTILSSELAARIKRNKRYSTRAFAKDLNINDSTLSQLISGKRKITNKRITILGKKLGLSDENILKLIEKEDISLDRNAITITLEQFNLMSEWYFDAIIEYTKVNPQTNAKELTKIFDISYAQAKTALDQLVRLKVLERKEDNYICQQAVSLTSYFDPDFTTEALKNYQEQLLNLSKTALYKSPRNERNHTSHVIAASSKQIPEIIKRIRDFEQELADFIESTKDPKDEVIAMQFSMFKLTNTGVNI